MGFLVCGEVVQADASMKVPPKRKGNIPILNLT